MQGSALFMMDNNPIFVIYVHNIKNFSTQSGSPSPTLGLSQIPDQRQIVLLQNIQFHRMSRAPLPKDTGSSTFYNTYQATLHSDSLPFAAKRRLLNVNTEAVDSLQIEVEGKMEKLKERVALHEGRMAKNYIELQEVKVEVQRECQRMANDRETDSIAREHKDIVREKLKECKGRTAAFTQKTVIAVDSLIDGVQSVGKGLFRQKDQRQSSMVGLIDEFQTQMLLLEKQLKEIRHAEEEVFERMEVEIYNLEQGCNGRLEEESCSRKREHETIIKLIGECIENFRYVY